MIGRGPIRLTAREDRIGGEAVPAFSVWGSIKGIRRLTVLVHGYNNTQLTAEDTWIRVYNRLAEITGGRSMSSLALYYWPCETKFQPTSKFSYPLQVSKAITCGRYLGELIRDTAAAGPDLTVQFVGHSLGCRLVLEALATIGPSAQVKLKSALLMAAAVPVGLCEGSRDYSTKQAVDELVLFSENDSVLRNVFGIGQFGARLLGDPNPGAHGEAVGSRGHPSTRWDDTDDTGLEHSEYWGDSRCLEHIASLLTTRKSRRVRLRSLAFRKLPTRSRNGSAS
jgi:Alpha/beta hydrolase of unknown function (DUF900)